MANQAIDIDGFTIIKRLGVGARTVIYQAKDESTGELVALKRALFESPEDSRIFEQMETEYRVGRTFEHPYIRRCFKLLRRRKMLRTSELLLTMELFDGQSLEDGPSLSLGDILLIFKMVAIGLNNMHQQGWVHCDIKPNNIMIGGNGSIKIIDLGQSCRIGAIKKRIQGTPDYIAPEQVRRQHLGHRTDIFNLGATMYWALTGKNVPTLIPAKTEYGLPANKIEPFKAPHEMHRRIPKSVSEIVMQCVEEKPSDRPANMMEIVERMDVQIRKVFGKRLGKNNETST